ncbi:hypothetical protein KUF54_07090 [Comamonas sp. Y33R10-2]|uniref:hypothetical protein n=1 Tax=Comamonas sp. Y33R10-2 TaxID=2853257 RepID=UPI001C5CB96A|nr:hypothetical protein [Comamonas sp. Y33R10-2]QXZ10951.1 hypothetical protein KUF54_07090 [Comamonas sp. Y33R10-2]
MANRQAAEKADSFYKFLALKKAELIEDLKTNDPFDRIVICGQLEELKRTESVYLDFLKSSGV